MAVRGTVLPSELWKMAEADESAKVRLLEASRIEAMRSDEEVSLSEDEVALLHQFIATDGPDVRAQAIEVLSEWGPVTWGDVERWLLDEDETVRDATSYQIDSDSALSELCCSDRDRSAALFASSAVKYERLPITSTLCKFDMNWVIPIFAQMGHLIDLGMPELNSQIICGPLEDFLVYDLVTIDSSLLQSWIKGDSIERKMALLSVVQWFGAREPWQRQIAEQLSEDCNHTVSATAKNLLAGQPMCDIQCREWAEYQGNT